MSVKANKLKVVIDGVERNAEVTAIKITTEDADGGSVSFAEAAAGATKTWFLEGSAFQNASDPDSVWSLLWSHVGEEVVVSVNPYASVAAAVATPWYTGTVKITVDGDVLGGEASGDTPAERFTTDFKWEFVSGQPTKVIA